MPLLRIDLYKGRTEAERKTLLDALHRAMLAAFKVPERDRYQVVHEHDPATMLMARKLGMPDASPGEGFMAMVNGMAGAGA